MDRPAKSGEAIEMCLRRFNYFPHVFRWHGYVFRVRAVERCWAQAAASPFRGPARRLWFRVRAAADARSGGGPAESRLEVYQDLAANTWHLGRLLAPKPAGGG